MDAAKEYMLRRELQKLQKQPDALRERVEEIKADYERASAEYEYMATPVNGDKMMDALRAVQIANRVLGAAEKKAARDR